MLIGSQSPAFHLRNKAQNWRDFRKTCHHCLCQAIPEAEAKKTMTSGPVPKAMARFTASRVGFGRTPRPGIVALTGSPNNK